MSAALELAQDAYAKAQASGTTSDWRHAAMLLYKIRRRPKQTRRKCVYPFPVARATFGDGTIVRMAFYSAVGKPLDLDRAKRVCTLAYRNRKAWDQRHNGQRFLLPFNKPTAMFSLMVE